MKKKQLKKEQERIKKERREVYMDFSDKKGVMTVVKVSLGVIGFLAIIFLGINIFNGNINLFTRKDKDIPSIDSSLVLCGTMFNKETDEYVVMAYNFDNEEHSVYRAASEEKETSIYFLNLDSGFNSTCIGEKSNIVSDAAKIKLSGPTLLRIKGSKIVKSYTTKDSIKSYLSNLK